MNLQELLAEVLDHIRGMWRYRWLATAVAWLIVVAGCFHVYSLPDQYRASVRIFVDTQSLLDPLLAGLTAPGNVNEVQLLSRMVLTRPNLEKVAMATDLDLRAATPDETDNLISELRDNVNITGGRDDIFTIEYQDPSKKKAEEVTEALKNIFVGGALGNRDVEIQESEVTLENEINYHVSRLNEAEARRGQFKRDNIGFMPTQAGDYYARLQAALGDRAGTERALQLARTKRNELERQIAGEEPSIGIVVNDGGFPCTQRSSIDRLEQDLINKKILFTDRHPQVESLEEMISQYKKECDDEIAKARENGSFNRLASPIEANPVYQNWKMQLGDMEVEIATLEAQAREQANRVDEMEKNMNRTIFVEAELAQLDRDYAVIYDRLQSLYERLEALKATKRTENVAETAQFEIIDPTWAAPDPVGPNRQALIGTVLVIALGVGAALAFVLNQVRPVYFTRDKLKNQFEFPVIGSVTMLLPPEVVMRRRFEAATWSFACLMLIAFAGFAIALAAQLGPLLRNALNGVTI